VQSDEAQTLMGTVGDGVDRDDAGLRFEGRNVRRAFDRCRGGIRRFGAEIDDLLAAEKARVRDRTVSLGGGAQASAAARADLASSGAKTAPRACASALFDESVTMYQTVVPFAVPRWSGSVTTPASGSTEIVFGKTMLARGSAAAFAAGRVSSATVNVNAVAVTARSSTSSWLQHDTRRCAPIVTCLNKLRKRFAVRLEKPTFDVRVRCGAGNSSFSRR
jgi:hypothetical protein